VRQTYAARLSHWVTVFSWPVAAAGATPPGTPLVAWVATLPVLRATRARGQMRPEVEGPLRRAERSSARIARPPSQPRVCWARSAPEVWRVRTQALPEVAGTSVAAARGQRAVAAAPAIASRADARRRTVAM
jgi:hypothetical protein